MKIRITSDMFLTATIVIIMLLALAGLLISCAPAKNPTPFHMTCWNFVGDVIVDGYFNKMVIFASHVRLYADGEKPIDVFGATCLQER